MKQDNIRFRRLQKEKEKEVAQLKQRERKKDFEIVKLKNRFEKHMTVLNQKLAKYKQEKRRSLEKSSMKTAKDKKILQKNVNDWLDREMEVVVCSKLTEFHYQSVEDKLKSTQEEINNLRNSCSPSLSEEKQNMLIKEAERLKSVLEVHKRKLTELKGNKSDFKDEKSEDRWNEINSMAEAKIALGTLFKKCVSAEVSIEMQKDLLEQEKDQESFNIHSYEEKIKVLNDEIAELKENMQCMRSNYEDQITKLNLESQCKALDYLKEMNSLIGSSSESEKDTSLKGQIEFQAQEISRLSQVAKQFDTLNKENENLKEQLFKAKKGKKVNWLFAPTSGSTSAVSSVTSSSATYVGGSMVEEYLSDDAEELSSDKNDPDWRLTPLNKQKRALKHKNSDDEDRFSTSTYIIPAKRMAKPCQCPGDCRTMRCACRKRNDPCSSNCLCEKDICINI
ncbi:Chromosome-associated kinesin KIF4B, partial [Stegodyphus mimosarum]